MRELGLQGVAVLRVAPGSSAQEAGLRGVRVIEETNQIVPGDVILAVDGDAVDSVAQLLSRLDDKQVGDAVRLSVWRDGNTIDVTVTLQASGEAATL